MCMCVLENHKRNMEECPCESKSTIVCGILYDLINNDFSNRNTQAGRMCVCERERARQSEKGAEERIHYQIIG